MHYETLVTFESWVVSMCSIIFVSFFFLTFFRNRFDYCFVENFTAHLLEKQSALCDTKKTSYSQNIESAIYSDSPVKYDFRKQSMTIDAFENSVSRENNILRDVELNCK